MKNKIVLLVSALALILAPIAAHADSCDGKEKSKPSCEKSCSK